MLLETVFNVLVARNLSNLSFLYSFVIENRVQREMLRLCHDKRQSGMVSCKTEVAKPTRCARWKVS